MIQNGYIRYEEQNTSVFLRMCDAKSMRQVMTNHPERFAAEHAAADLTGLMVRTLNRHVAKSNIFGAVVGGKVLISKQSLIGYLTAPDVVRKIATEQLKKLLAGYRRAGK